MRFNAEHLLFEHRLTEFATDVKKTFGSKRFYYKTSEINSRVQQVCCPFMHQMSDTFQSIRLVIMCRLQPDMGSVGGS